MEGQDTIDALLFLATYYKNKSDFTKAEKFCTRLLDYTGRVSLKNYYNFLIIN